MDAGENIRTHLQHTSLYSQRKPTERMFAHKPPENLQKLECALIFPNLKSRSPRITKKTMSPDQDSEIDVFGAEKYFSMKLDDPSPSQSETVCNDYGHQLNKNDDPRWLRPRSRPRTPSGKSESSYSSQTYLLRSYLGNQPQRKSIKANSTGILGGFGCKGKCLNGKSVRTDEQSLTQIKTSGNYPRRDLHRAKLQTKNDIIRVTTPRLGRIASELKIQDSFGLSVEKKDVAVNLDRKVSMLAWDAIPKLPNPLKPRAHSVSSQTCDDDLDSDGSSDLFEIENIRGPMFNPGRVISPDYEPSEASIEWSVVTRSAADFSVASDFDEKRVSENHERKKPNLEARLDSVAEKDVRKTCSGGLLSGCKSHKAVKVIEPEAKIHALQGTRRPARTYRLEDINFP